MDRQDRRLLCVLFRHQQRTLKFRFTEQRNCCIVKSVTLRNNDAPSRDVSAKREEYDINCVVDGEDGDQCDVEMQASHMAGDNAANSHRNIKWRSVYNLCDLHSNQVGSGHSYGRLVRSYQVTLCNYRVFAGNHELDERFTFRNARGEELCDAVTAIFIDLTQAAEIAKRPVSEMSDIEAWTVFFALGGDHEYSAVITEIAKAREGISVANDTLKSISQDPDERARYRSRRIWLQDREHERAIMRELQEAVEEKDAALADKDAVIADKDAVIEALRKQLTNLQ